MKRRHYIFGLLLIIGVFTLVHGYQRSTKHVSKMMAGEPHTLNCMSCHAYSSRDGLLTRMTEPDYLSPFNLAIDPESGDLLVIAQAAEQLIKVDPSTKAIKGRIQLGQRPHSIVISKVSNLAYVSNQWSNTLSVIDIPQLQIIDTIDVGAGPGGIDMDETGKTLFVANTYSDDISIVDIASGSEQRRLAAGNEPIGVVASNSSIAKVMVSSRRALPDQFRAEPKTEITLVNTLNQRVDSRQIIPSGHIMENIAFSEQENLAIATMISPKNLLPSVQIEQGWMMNHGIIVTDIENGRTTRFILDEPNAFYPDPYDIVIDQNRKIGFVSHSGADIISVIDINAIDSIMDTATVHELESVFPNNLGMSRSIVIKRIAVGANPKGMALSPDNKLLYVAERLEDRIAIIDVAEMTVIDHIQLGVPTVSTVRLGAQMFNNAGHTFHQQYSCYTCHPDGHEDGLTYDMSSKGGGRNLANVQTLRDLAGTAPFKWNGTNTSIYMQCGMRFSKFITRTEAFSPDQLDALVAYIIQDLNHPPNMYKKPNAPLTVAQARGKVIYERSSTNSGEPIPAENQCITCHPAPNYSNFKTADVGTLADTDIPTAFDSPNLNNVYESAPYLHDGSANTLEEIWTLHNDYDEHGVANDLTKEQLNDLIEYLKSLGAAEDYLNVKQQTIINHAKF
jgi:YVTN family beta-propeller protein